MRNGNLNLPLVSICILAFNHEKYIKRAIDSAICQTYENIEIIVVDNGSKDDTSKVIESEFKYELDNDEIQFHRLDLNTFPSHGTNFGLSKANGKYICLLSGDDSFVSNKIKRQVEVMLDKKINNLFTWVNVINEYDEVFQSELLESVFNRNYSSQEIKEHFVSDGNMLCALSGMFDRDIFVRYGYFDERLVQLQDFDFWLRIVKYEKLNLLTEKLTNYRERGDGGNLSLILSNERHFRTEFEEIYINKHILNFDNTTLSNVIGAVCNDENKHKLLIKYYIDSNRLSRAKGFMLCLYEHLGDRIDFPSDEYDFFFDMYSKIDFFNNTVLQAEVARLRLIENSRLWRLSEPIRIFVNKIKSINFLFHRIK
jgi:glycosyltransferase involved in cell wall biosynthesis